MWGAVRAGSRAWADGKDQGPQRSGGRRTEDRGIRRSADRPEVLPSCPCDSDERARLLELFALQHHQGPCVECYRTGAARTNIELTRPEPADGRPHFAARARETGYVSTHALPLRLRSRVIGALSLFQSAPHRLGDDDIALAQALADVATIAILQQRTLQQSQVVNSRLETALTSRVLVEQAKGVLAERWSTSVDDAFAAFRSYARARHLRLSDLATRIVSGDFDTADIPLPAPVSPEDRRR
ncbi:GAF and ANTAR domain-containing protein [Streptomyces coeruleorubidus]|uniref:GAF and ANTAR domain-containing protein n=1 Tax=Streptomyces coeruleorubidus TaxID=116188 RepID=UPI00237F56E4|nr:GAF and ANTAR domain-containing protein [Streptomyces coeruleorubidus]WDV53231.1 GAF and ANTAR domain-containing protein [Streptomyces coeruleorubidus]